MMQQIRNTRETQPAAAHRQTATELEASQAGGLKLSLWLLAVLIAEVQVLLWIVERASEA